MLGSRFVSNFAIPTFWIDNQLIKVNFIESDKLGWLGLYGYIYWEIYE